MNRINVKEAKNPAHALLTFVRKNKNKSGNKKEPSKIFAPFPLVPQINKHKAGIRITSIHADKSFGNGKEPVGYPIKASPCQGALYLKDG